MRVLVVGGGAAGMMAAVAAADAGAQVILAEKNEKTGKKIYITGKGRCNITNACPVEDFFDHVISNPRFLYSALYSFTQEDMCAFLEREGLPLKEERGSRIFPLSDKSSDVIRTLNHAMQRRGVKVLLHSEVQELVTGDDEAKAHGQQTDDGAKAHGQQTGGRVKGAVLKDGRMIAADAVIVATGGLSCPSTGSTGDGYRFAEDTGHRLVSVCPSLVPLTVSDPDVRFLEGLSLRNIRIKLGSYEDFGEMLFTSDGVSGPVILSASAVSGIKPDSILSIDLKPALSPEQLDERILRDFQEGKNKDYCNALSGLLPAKLIPVIIARSQIPEHKKVHDITREERRRLGSLLKDFRFHVTGTRGFDQAVITKGGIHVKDVDPSTLESKKVRGLYFAGEVLDVDAFTGGFNLQIAWSTGHLAGDSAARAN